MSNGLAAAFGQDDFHYVAHFSLPPDSIDVNVHPNKTIIKVMEMSKLIGLLSSTIKDLASKQNYSKNKVQLDNSEINYQSNELLIEDSIGTELPQAKHHYNMEGFFSPHRISESERDDLIWIGSTFLKKIGPTFFVFSAHKLLEYYTQRKMKTVSPSFPLLVSEPFSSKDVTSEQLYKLNACGMELEFLGKETIVLRSIPDWMNGFPLRPVIQCLINREPFSKINFIPSDWSQSTWEQILIFFPIDELITEKIALDLGNLLRERFK